MALLSGEQRSATVVAKTDVECYRLDRASFQELMAARPQIAEEVKRVVGVRQNDLEQARVAYARSGNGGQTPPPPTLVGRLQRFLRIKN